MSSMEKKSSANIERLHLTGWSLGTWCTDTGCKRTALERVLPQLKLVSTSWSYAKWWRHFAQIKTFIVSKYGASRSAFDPNAVLHKSGKKSTIERIIKVNYNSEYFPSRSTYWDWKIHRLYQLNCVKELVFYRCTLDFQTLHQFLHRYILPSEPFVTTKSGDQKTQQTVKRVFFIECYMSPYDTKLLTDRMPSIQFINDDLPYNVDNLECTVEYVPSRSVEEIRTRKKEFEKAVNKHWILKQDQ